MAVVAADSGSGLVEGAVRTASASTEDATAAPGADSEARSEFRQARDEFINGRDRYLQTVGTDEELPVTGLAAIPLALAGLLMVALGSAGMRRYAPGRVAADTNPHRAVDDGSSLDGLRPRGAVVVLDRPEAAEPVADTDAGEAATGEPPVGGPSEP